MILGEYIFPYPDDSGYFEYVSAVQDREIAYLHTLLNNDRGAVLDILSIRVGSIRKAPMKDGLFPLIVYIPDLGRGIAENFVLCEYLASYGFIVAATHSVGTSSLNTEINPADRETQVDDAGFLLSQMRDYPNVDSEKTGALGFRAGGSASLLLGARNSNIDAVAGLDGLYLSGEHLDYTAQSPYFALENVKIPVFSIYPADDPGHDLSLRDSLVYSQRYSCEFKDFTGRDLTGYGIISTYNLYSEKNEKSDVNTGFEIACAYLFNFFNGYLNGNEKSMTFIENTSLANPRYLMTVQKAEIPPPTSEQFASILAEKGVEATYEIYNKYKRPGRSFFREANFNAIGYRFFQGGDIDKAIMIFEMNADAYPDSPNTWDSLGEACEAAGRADEAIKYLRKVLEILPADSTTDERFKEQIKNHAEEALRRLEG